METQLWECRVELSHEERASRSMAASAKRHRARIVKDALDAHVKKEKALITQLELEAREEERAATEGWELQDKECIKMEVGTVEQLRRVDTGEVVHERKLAPAELRAKQPDLPFDPPVDPPPAADSSEPLRMSLTELAKRLDRVQPAPGSPTEGKAKKASAEAPAATSPETTAELPGTPEERKAIAAELLEERLLTWLEKREGATTYYTEVWAAFGDDAAPKLARDIRAQELREAFGRLLVRGAVEGDWDRYWTLTPAGQREPLTEGEVDATVCHALKQLELDEDDSASGRWLMLHTSLPAAVLEASLARLVTSDAVEQFQRGPEPRFRFLWPGEASLSSLGRELRSWLVKHHGRRATWAQLRAAFPDAEELGAELAVLVERGIFDLLNGVDWVLCESPVPLTPIQVRDKVLAAVRAAGPGSQIAAGYVHTRTGLSEEVVAPLLAQLAEGGLLEELDHQDGEAWYVVRPEPAAAKPSRAAPRRRTVDAKSKAKGLTSKGPKTGSRARKAVAEPAE